MASVAQTHTNRSGEPLFATVLSQLKLAVVTKGPWWAASLLVHMLLLLVLTLLMGKVAAPVENPDAVSFDTEMEDLPPPPDLSGFDVGDPPLETSVLDTESLTMLEAPQIDQSEQFNDDSAVFEESGGGMATASALDLGGAGGFDVNALGDGPVVRGAGGVGSSEGNSKSGGRGGAGAGFGSRGSGSRKAMLGKGGTKQTERAVAAGLNWIARHQNPNGSWSMDHSRLCKDPSCTGRGNANTDTAATALALLPFLAAGQTHETKGPYQKTIYGGLNFLIKSQKSDGDLRGGSTMYSHGLAAIVLCEAYGLSQDKKIGVPAQGALDFIKKAQDSQGGGWRYEPGQPGDTSVVGWQVMALKSGQMAGLKVDPRVLDGANNFLNACAKGSAKGLFSYEPPGGPTPTMTAVGLLCRQYMGMKRDDPAMAEGMTLVMQNLPNNEAGRNSYYWYYATQVMHNVPGPEWDNWNRSMRRAFISTQAKEGCAAGSWDPDKPTKDAWGEPGGRLMVTSLACLSLEVYYRYLPLYQLDGKDELADQMADNEDMGADLTGKKEMKKDKPAKKKAKPDANEDAKMTMASPDKNAETRAEPVGKLLKAAAARPEAVDSSALTVTAR